MIAAGGEMGIGSPSSGASPFSSVFFPLMSPGLAEGHIYRT